MIQETRTYRCRRCGSGYIVKNGRNRYGNPQYPCKACGAYGVLEPKVRYMEAQKEQILRAYQERVSLRGLHRMYGVFIGTVLRWIQKSRLSPPGSRDLAAGRGRGRPGSFVGRKDRKVWMSAHSTGHGLRRGRPKRSHRSEALGSHPGSLSGLSELQRLRGGRCFRLPPADPPLCGQAIGPAGSYRAWHNTVR
jgi:transposase-like protein